MKCNICGEDKHPQYGCISYHCTIRRNIDKKRSNSKVYCINCGIKVKYELLGFLFGKYRQFVDGIYCDVCAHHKRVSNIESKQNKKDKKMEKKNDTHG